MTKATASPIDALPLGKLELIALLALLMSLNALSIDAMLPALAEMARELGAQRGNDRQLIVAVYIVFMGIGCLWPGSFADRHGRRPIILLSLAAMAVLSLLTAMLTDFTAVLILRAITAVLAAGLIVAPVAVVRDLYEGDGMARLMSLIAAVFITVPVIAPSLGQAILLVAGWRWIFVALSASGAMAAAWVWFRLPETLAPENVQSISVPAIARNMRAVLTNREVIGYVLGSMLLLGSVYGYLNSAQQLFQQHFGVGELFPLAFGATAAMMVVSNITNSRIVMRFGARRVSHLGVIVFVIVSAVQVWSSYVHPQSLPWFITLMSINLALLGFLGSNFSSIAMQPFAHIAGAASSVQTFLRMFGAAMVGLLIGQSYDGTSAPFAWSLLICSSCALLLVLFSERGRLFRRFNTGPVHRIFP